MQKKQEARKQKQSNPVTPTRRFREWLSSLLPPGYNRSEEKRMFFAKIAFLLFFSIRNFSVDYRDAYRLLCDPEILERQVLLPGAIMTDFVSVLGANLRLYQWMALALLTVQLWSRYRYFTQGARADYTLRRLPQRHARFRYCWSLPLLEAAAILLLMVVMLLIFYGYYMYLTPDACLAPGQWQKLQQAGWGILW